MRFNMLIYICKKVGNETLIVSICHDGAWVKNDIDY